MFGGLLDLRELQVSDVMVHRTEMVMINADLPPEELVREVLATEYTRIPLWRDKPENIIGVLHAKDLLRAIRAADGDTGKIDVSTIALPPWFVPEMRSVSEQLKAFRRRKTHFALVVDEYGEVEGMVTLEDILEEIVGDISDEHDVVVAGVRAQPDGSVVVDGSVPIRDLNRAMDWHLPDEEATTIAGLVIHEARSIPERGQSFTFHGFRFRVLRRERNRITATATRRSGRCCWTAATSSPPTATTPGANGRRSTPGRIRAEGRLCSRCLSHLRERQRVIPVVLSAAIVHHLFHGQGAIPSDSRGPGRSAGGAGGAASASAGPGGRDPDGSDGGHPLRSAG
jgi:Mg2+/Co2+ transporter CorC